MKFTDFYRKKYIIPSALLWIFTFILYAQSIGFGFINFDDYAFLLGRPHLYNENSFLSGLNEILFQSFPREGPMLLRDISWAFDSYMYGLKNPLGYHLGNVILHSSNIVLLFAFLLISGWSYFYAIAISATYASLPLHAEAVCWVMGRKDLLVTFFMLSGLIVQTQYLETQKKESKRILYLLLLFITLLALLSKVSSLTYFLVLTSYHIFYPYLKYRCHPASSFQFKQAGKIIPKYLPHFLLSVFIYIWYTHPAVRLLSPERGPDIAMSDHIRHLLLFTPLVLAIYAKLIFIPFGHSVYYTWPTIHRSLEFSQIFLSLCISVCLILSCFILYRKRKDIFFYVLMFFVLMIPYLNIIYFGIWLANRYIYFASFCILVIAALFAKETAQTFQNYGKNIVFALWICFLLCSIYRTLVYQQVWKDDRALWQYETELKNPSLMAFSSLAYSYLRETQDLPEKKEMLLKKARISIEKGFLRFQNAGLRETSPHLFKLYFLQGMIAGMKGESLEKQLVFYEKAYTLKPENKECVRKMAEIYYRLAEHESDMETRKEKARMSLRYFKKYMHLTKNVPGAARSHLHLLKNAYDAAFPFLQSETAPLQKELMGKEFSGQ